MQTQVLIIGGGVSGTGLARDLALRGVDCVVAEKQDVNAGASGGNHGLLHSGARYIASDPAAACECRVENQLLKRLAPHCIEDTGGLFVAVAGDDERYIAEFPDRCARCGIAARALPPDAARAMEPALAANVIAAFEVDDATIDPFKLSLDNLAAAQQAGGRLLRHHQVIGFDLRAGRIRAARLRDVATGRAFRVEAELVVNAAGAWAGRVAALAGAAVAMRYSKGSLLVTQTRIARRVLNRLRPPTDGDILAPGGTVSILGTTSERVVSPDGIRPEIHELDTIIAEGAAMVPELAATRYIRAYCGVRPLLGAADSPDAQSDRSLSRGFALIDHERQPEKTANLITITGGKLTTYRLMAEKAADLVCEKLGIASPGRTRTEPLPDGAETRWTEPGLAPRLWLRRSDPDDRLLCECEMVPQSAVEEILRGIDRQGGRPGLTAISLRSRIGKGPCQGTFCSQRVVAWLYDRRRCDGQQGVAELRAFLRERWRGQQPLLWDEPLAQAELLEAMHCGFFGLELGAPPPARNSWDP
jgi:glycerol-3-phosphate dehydrogenase